MIKLQFALWRRDVAIRKLKAYRATGWISTRKEKKLEQRVDRWTVIANSLIPS